MEDPVVRRAQHPLAGEAADEAGDIRVRDRLARADDAAEGMAAHGLDDRVAVLPRAEAGADADDERRVGDCGAEILFCEDRVDHHVRPQPRAADGPGVGEHGDLPG